MIGIAFTGSGKTITFCLPLIMLALEEEVSCTRLTSLTLICARRNDFLLSLEKALLDSFFVPVESLLVKPGR